MTNNEAIKELKLMRYNDANTGDMDRALAMAIEALSNSQNQSDFEFKTTTGTVSATDVIYRQDAIDAAIKADIENHNGILSEKRARVFENHIAILPSAQRTGEWNICDDGYVLMDEKMCPSADVVEVVRCKDCKYHLNGHLCKQLSQYGSIETPQMFYCGFGERNA